jgi:phytoene synthase
MGRMYLPQKELDKYNVSPENIRRGVVDDSFKSFMKFQIKRARSYYSESYPGLKFITDKNSRFIAKIMGVIYSGILDSIEDNNYDVFSKRNFVPLNRKIILFLKTTRSINES